MASIASSQEAGFTALHMAARHGHVAVLRFLLEAGAKLDCRDQMGANVLHTAAEHGQVPIRRICHDGLGLAVSKIMGSTPSRTI